MLITRHTKRNNAKKTCAKTTTYPNTVGHKTSAMRASLMTQAATDHCDHFPAALMKNFVLSLPVSLYLWTSGARARAADGLLRLGRGRNTGRVVRQD